MRLKFSLELTRDIVLEKIAIIIFRFFAEVIFRLVYCTCVIVNL